MMPRRNHKSVNYLDCVPARAIGHEQADDGGTVLLRPKWIKGPLARFVQPRLKRKHFKVRLDKFGAATWEAIDGQRTVGQIADFLFERFGEEIEPRYERCSRFIFSLQKGSMVTISDPSETAKEER